MERLLYLMGTHFLGDFAFQSAWMVEFKGKDMRIGDTLISRWWEVLIYHVFVYVSTMVVFMRLVGYTPTPQGIVMDAATHFIIDTLKARNVFGVRVIKWIWLDQLCHLTVRAWLWYVEWL